MAAIHIKGRNDPIFVSNDKAEKIKTLWAGDVEKGIKPLPRSSILDLGDWCGEYGQIKAISVEREKLPAPEKHEELPFTEHERNMRRALLDKMRMSLEQDGILQKRVTSFNQEGEKSTGYKINRSGLNEYKKKFGSDYAVPVGTEIIEDVILIGGGFDDF